MSNETEPDPIAAIVRTGQIIVGAMASGVLIFLVVVFLLVGRGGPQANPRPQGLNSLITFIALGYSVIALALWRLVPPVFTTASIRAMARRRGPLHPPKPAVDTAELARLHLPQMIVGTAILEGAAFFDAIAYLIEGNPLALGAALVLCGALLFCFPTLTGVEGWIDLQKEKLEAERHLEP
jgi:hypothetical protein